MGVDPEDSFAAPPTIFPEAAVAVPSSDAQATSEDFPKASLFIRAHQVYLNLTLTLTLTLLILTPNPQLWRSWPP